MPAPESKAMNQNSGMGGLGLHPFLDTGGAPAVLAHRGYCKRHPENTMAAFEDAIRLGVRYLETDVQATS